MQFRYIALTVVVLALGFGYFGLYRPHLEREIGMGRIREVEKALDLYYEDCKSFPSAEEGLKPLVQKSQTCEKWQGPYIDEKLLKDEWNRPYIYSRQEEYYSLKSFGADGQPGGTGANQDLPDELSTEN